MASPQISSVSLIEQIFQLFLKDLPTKQCTGLKPITDQSCIDVLLGKLFLCFWFFFLIKDRKEYFICKLC